MGPWDFFAAYGRANLAGSSGRRRRPATLQAWLVVGYIDVQPEHLQLTLKLLICVAPDLHRRLLSALDKDPTIEPGYQNRQHQQHSIK